MTSWILDTRRRLSEPPPRHLEGPAEGGSSVLSLPLYVESGELWTTLVDTPLGHLGLEGVAGPGQHHLPASPIEPQQSAWQVVQGEMVMRFGLDAGKVLLLGELDEIEVLGGFRLQPIVLAIPPPADWQLSADQASGDQAPTPLPLTAVANPRLTEEIWLTRGEESWCTDVLHLGAFRVWGPSATVLLELLARLSG